LNIGRHLVSPHKIFDFLKVTIEDDWSDSVMILGDDKVNDRGDLWETIELHQLKEVTLYSDSIIRSNYCWDCLRNKFHGKFGDSLPQWQRIWSTKD